MTGFEKLENSLIDVIKEEQAKLGFKEEKIHLYYPLSSLNHFFSAQDSADEMAARLQNLPEELTSKLGEVRVSHKGDRFCFYIPEPGSVYVHENMKENEFIKVLIELVQKHECTKVKLLDLFASYWEKTECQEMDNGEFDFYIAFWIRQMTRIITALKMRVSTLFIIDFCQRIMRILDFEFHKSLAEALKSNKQ